MPYLVLILEVFRGTGRMKQIRSFSYAKEGQMQIAKNSGYSDLYVVIHPQVSGAMTIACWSNLFTITCFEFPAVFSAYKKMERIR